MCGVNSLFMCSRPLARVFADCLAPSHMSHDSWIGNLAGTLFCATLLSAAGIITSNIAQIIYADLVFKLRYRDNGAAGWFQVVLSGCCAIGLLAWCVCVCCGCELGWLCAHM